MAAGKGTRLGGLVPKPLSEISNGVSILVKLLKTTLKLKPLKLIVVVGHKASDVIANIENYYPNSNNIDFVFQEKLNGTLGAAESGMSQIVNNDDLILILPADNAWFLKSTTLQSLVTNHLEQKAVVSTLLTHEFNDRLHKVEYLVSNDRIKSIRTRTQHLKTNRKYFAGTGILCIEKKYLEDNKKFIEPLPSGEYTVSRIIEVALNQKKVVGCVPVSTSEILTINTPSDLNRLRLLAKASLNTAKH